MEQKNKFSHSCILLGDEAWVGRSGVGHLPPYVLISPRKREETYGWFCNMCGVELVEEERRVKEQIDWEQVDQKKKYLTQEEYEYYSENEVW